MTLTMEEIRDIICKSMSMASQSIEFDSKEHELWWFNGYIESAIDIMERLERANNLKNIKDNTSDIFD